MAHAMSGPVVERHGHATLACVGQSDYVAGEPNQQDRFVASPKDDRRLKRAAYRHDDLSAGLRQIGICVIDLIAQIDSVRCSNVADRGLEAWAERSTLGKCHGKREDTK